jgi:hypothetical protein
MKKVNQRKLGKRRNPYWLSARGVNLGSISQKIKSELLDENEHDDRM